MTTLAANWGVYGHDWAVAHLQESIANGRMRHAYLFAGAESVGKETLARALAQALFPRQVEFDGDGHGILDGVK